MKNIDAIKPKKKIAPVRIIAGSFAIIIIVGTLLLMLPFSSRDGRFTNFFDALFVSTSATCITGLTLFDTFTKWSLFGQVIIMLLVQVGGIGIVSLITFFTLSFKGKLGFRDLLIAGENINNSSFTDIPKVIRLVVIVTLAFEAAGALLLAIRFVPLYGPYGIFMAAFMSISAYCNAGFDLMGIDKAFSSLTQFNNDPLVMYTIAALIICGGLGFIVVYDLINYRKTRRLAMHTKIVLSLAAIFIIIGAVGVFILESSNTMGHLNLFEKINASIFQSVSARTAGFNSIDIASMNSITKLLIIFLMFIGAAPGSTGGGIKTTTFAVIVAAIWSVIRLRDDTVFFRRRIDKHIVYKAMAIFFLSAAITFITALIIVFSQHNISNIDSFFEAVSAFGTVGLTANVTQKLNALSKAAIILTMYIGRIGPISFFLAISTKTPKKHGQVLPEGKIIVG